MIVQHQVPPLYRGWGRGRRLGPAGEAPDVGLYGGEGVAAPSLGHGHLPQRQPQQLLQHQHVGVSVVLPEAPSHLALVHLMMQQIFAGLEQIFFMSNKYF